MRNEEILELYFKEFKISCSEKANILYNKIRTSNHDSKPESFNTIYT